MKTGLRLAIITFVLVWVPLTVLRGLAMGRSFRIGSEAQGAVSPLFDAMVQIGFVMLASA